MEGIAGWNPGKPMPGNLNMAYSTETLGIATCPESTVLGLLEESSWSTLLHTHTTGTSCAAQNLHSNSCSNTNSSGIWWQLSCVVVVLG